MKVGYRENEILSVYVDENGDRQIVPFDTFDEAVEFTTAIRNCGTSIIGVMTTVFYNHYVECIINDGGELNEEKCGR